MEFKKKEKAVDYLGSLSNSVDEEF